MAARQFGLKVGAPVFIPFMGAFIALKDAPKNAWIESCVGIGGPLLGDIPYMGWLFKNRLLTTKKTELLVFITPKIVTDRIAAR